MTMLMEIRGVVANGAVFAGVGGGVAALTMIPNPEAKLFAGAMMLALAVGGALRKALFAPLDQTRVTDFSSGAEPQEYPFTARNPWDRNNAPTGL